MVQNYLIAKKICGLVEFKNKELNGMFKLDVKKVLDENIPLDGQAIQKEEFPPIEPLIAYVAIKTKEAELLLENLCKGLGDEMYIEYKRKLIDYKEDILKRLRASNPN